MINEINHPIALPTYRYDLVIVSLFHNEARFLKEWIEFHLLLGVKHFYLYNDLSQDHSMEILEPYIQQGIVEVEQGEVSSHNLRFHNAKQCDFFNRTLRKIRGHVHWSAFIDTDEFLFPKKGTTLVEFLKNYEECAGIAVNWRLFGSSGVEEVPKDRLMIEMLTKAAPLNRPAHKFVKSIVRPEYAWYFEEPHNAIYREGYGQVTSHKLSFPGRYTPDVEYDLIQLNHYWSRDARFFKENKLNRRLTWGDAKEQAYEANEVHNTEDNYDIFRFVPKLKERMGLN